MWNFCVIMGKGKRIVLVVFLISLALFVAFAVSSYYSSLHMVEVMRFSCALGTHAFTIYDLIPLIVTASLIFGAGIYYLMAGKVEGKERTVKGEMDIVLRFLDDEERKVVERLLSTEGGMPQSELSAIGSLSKVKAHRIVKRLSERGIVEIERHGKTNSISLAKEIREGLS